MDQLHDLNGEVPPRPRQDIGDWLSGGAAAGDGVGGAAAATTSPARSATSGHWLRRLLPVLFNGARGARPTAGE